MLEIITRSFDHIIGAIGKKKQITEADVKIIMNDLRKILLEADVARRIVENFCEKIGHQMLGQGITHSLKPDELALKIIHDELMHMLGKDAGELSLEKIPTVILLLGLQGSGKTTTTVKLAKRFRDKFKKNVLVASLDVYRPAAREQLQILSNQLGIDVLPLMETEKPLDICARAMNLVYGCYDMVLLDSAGRLTIDNRLMEELRQIRDFVKPTEAILVADASTGQEAIRVADTFQQQVGLDSIILTRLDSDGRCGAALSMQAVTQKPIRYMGTGEKMDDLELFHPQRIVSRLLNRGDIASLVEKTESLLDKREMESVEKKIKTGKFDLEDMLQQLRNVKKLGGIAHLIGFLPGVSRLKDSIQKQNPKDLSLKKQEAIICSMTKRERYNPDMLNASRKERIALGSGVDVHDVSDLLKKFKAVREISRRLGNSTENVTPNDLQKYLEGF
jgi:signal recognition particle subunit SRP54